ncbi:uncharacterized protein G2W53_036419 [Senna tora]|uniref:Uncharacterized protein n=1 Tax=Senna tora TaxID=362788 RepID=A0A834W8Q5_9FABA|nr:uncharacterized protein G2W53_036419 [Senna tora]
MGEKKWRFMVGPIVKVNDAVRPLIGDPRPTTTTVLRGLRLSTSFSIFPSHY